MDNSLKRPCCNKVSGHKQAMQLAGIFIENLTVLFIPKSGHKYSHTNSNIFSMSLVMLDDHLTAGAWAACEATYP